MLVAAALVAVFATGLGEAGFAATLPVVFFVAGVVRVFAGFFIALAIESNQPALRPSLRKAESKNNNALPPDQTALQCSAITFPTSL
ncbi:MAG: hypothetical protein V4488_20785 [Pseudomonadota bacterium]